MQLILAGGMPAGQCSGLLEPMDLAKLTVLRNADLGYAEVDPNRAGFRIIDEHLNRKIPGVLPQA